MTSVDELRTRLQAVEHELRESMEARKLAMIEEWARTSTEWVKLGEHCIKVVPSDSSAYRRRPVGQPVWLDDAFSEDGSLFTLPILIQVDGVTLGVQGPSKCAHLDVRVFNFQLSFEREGGCARLVTLYVPDRG